MKENYKFFYLVILLEIAMVILYGVFTEYNIEYKVKTENLENITNFYPMYQDIHVMIFIGFGFLMVFLR
jgi:ammonium transporter Rh